MFYGIDKKWFDLLKSFIGREIINAGFDDYGYLVLKFAGVDLLIGDDKQDCCEKRFMTCDESFDDFKGCILRDVEIVSSVSRELESGVEEIQFLRLHVAVPIVPNYHEGYVKAISNHNIHNGNYSGFDMKFFTRKNALTPACLATRDIMHVPKDYNEDISTAEKFESILVKTHKIPNRSINGTLISKVKEDGILYLENGLRIRVLCALGSDYPLFDLEELRGREIRDIRFDSHADGFLKAFSVRSCVCIFIYSIVN